MSALATDLAEEARRLADSPFRASADRVRSLGVYLVQRIAHRLECVEGLSPAETRVLAICLGWLALGGPEPVALMAYRRQTLMDAILAYTLRDLARTPDFAVPPETCPAPMCTRPIETGLSTCGDCHAAVLEVSP